MKNLTTRRLTSSDLRKGSMQGESVNYLRRNGAFFGLIITSPISLLLLVSSEKHWSFSGDQDYFGHSNDAIVAIGVTTNNASIEHILGIAAGKSYATLNATQCTITFTPRIFNISVSLSDRSINVTDISNGVFMSP